MSSNRNYEYTKYFSISKTAFGTGNSIQLRFTDMNNSGNIKLFTNDNSTIKQPTVTIQEIEINIKRIVDETRGSKTDQIAKD